LPNVISLTLKPASSVWLRTRVVVQQKNKSDGMAARLERTRHRSVAAPDVKEDVPWQQTRAPDQDVTDESLTARNELLDGREPVEKHLHGRNERSVDRDSRA
jgi:hypothetical protein